MAHALVDVAQLRRLRADQVPLVGEHSGNHNLALGLVELHRGMQRERHLGQPVGQRLDGRPVARLTRYPARERGCGPLRFPEIRSDWYHG